MTRWAATAGVLGVVLLTMALRVAEAQVARDCGARPQLGETLFPPPAFVREAVGPPDTIRSVLSDFVRDLGGQIAFGRGFREISFNSNFQNQVSAPNLLPPDYYRPHGLLLSTPGIGLQIAAPQSPPSEIPQRFGNLNPSYPANFEELYDGPGLLTPLGSTVLEVSFVVPGSAVGATVNGFGVVFTDVETPTSAKVEFFKDNGELLCFRLASPSGHGRLSFVGITPLGLDRIGRVRITSGTHPVGPDDAPPDVDIVVLADVIFGEPIGYATLTISPPSGMYVGSQQLDLVLILRTLPGAPADLRITGGRARVAFSFCCSVDVTAELMDCLIPGALIGGGRTFRCPNVKFGHCCPTLFVTLELSDGTTLHGRADWSVELNTEP